MTIQVSSGSGTIPIPDVAGQTEATARANLNSAGFTSITVQTEQNDDVPGQGDQVDPAPGTEVAPDQAITLVGVGGPRAGDRPRSRASTSRTPATSSRRRACQVTVSPSKTCPTPGRTAGCSARAPRANHPSAGGRDTVTIVVGRLGCRAGRRTSSPVPVPATTVSRPWPTLGAAPPRREHVEPEEPVHRLVRRALSPR